MALPCGCYSAAPGTLQSPRKVILHAGQITGISSSSQELGPRRKIRCGLFESDDALSGHALPSAPNLTNRRFRHCASHPSSTCLRTLKANQPSSRGHGHTCIGMVNSKVMEIEPMRGLTLSKLQIIMRGLDLGMGTECIGITASQRGRRCRIGIDTNIEACR
jgi:hypothetical protein